MFFNELKNWFKWTASVFMAPFILVEADTFDGWDRVQVVRATGASKASELSSSDE